MTLSYGPGDGLYFSSPSRIHCQHPVKTWKNLDRSRTSVISWNEEVCVHVGHGQVAACGWIPRAQVKVAHLFLVGA